MAISEHARGKTTFREGSALAQIAEKVFLSQMEIIRLKYPNTLEKLRSDQFGNFNFYWLFKYYTWCDNIPVLVYSKYNFKHIINVETKINYMCILDWFFQVTGESEGPINMSRKRDPDFCLRLSVSCKPIILLGVGLFLPHGENIRGNLRLTGIV